MLRHILHLVNSKLEQPGQSALTLFQVPRLVNTSHESSPMTKLRVHCP